MRYVVVALGFVTILFAILGLFNILSYNIVFPVIICSQLITLLVLNIKKDNNSNQTKRKLTCNNKKIAEYVKYKDNKTINIECKTNNDSV